MSEADATRAVDGVGTTLNLPVKADSEKYSYESNYGSNYNSEYGSSSGAPPPNEETSVVEAPMAT